MACVISMLSGTWPANRSFSRAAIAAIASNCCGLNISYALRKSTPNETSFSVSEMLSETFLVRIESSGRTDPLYTLKLPSISGPAIFTLGCVLDALIHFVEYCPYNEILHPYL